MAKAGEGPSGGPTKTAIENTEDEDVAALAPKGSMTGTSTSGSNAEVASSSEQSQPPKRTLVENNVSAEWTSSASSHTKEAESTPSASTRSAKEKEKARIMLELREIKLQRRLMELEDQDG